MLSLNNIFEIIFQHFDYNMSLKCVRSQTSYQFKKTALKKILECNSVTKIWSIANPNEKISWSKAWVHWNNDRIYIRYSKSVYNTYIGTAKTDR